MRASVLLACLSELKEEPRFPLMVSMLGNCLYSVPVMLPRQLLPLVGQILHVLLQGRIRGRLVIQHLGLLEVLEQTIPLLDGFIEGLEIAVQAGRLEDLLHARGVEHAARAAHFFLCVGRDLEGEVAGIGAGEFLDDRPHVLVVAFLADGEFGDVRVEVHVLAVVDGVAAAGGDDGHQFDLPDEVGGVGVAAGFLELAVHDAKVVEVLAEADDVGAEVADPGVLLAFDVFGSVEHVGHLRVQDFETHQAMGADLELVVVFVGLVVAEVIPFPILHEVALRAR